MIDLIHGDCLNDLPQIESNSVDVILTDPPYKYLKNQKLEVDFDEGKFFNEAKRILKKDGFIVLFGRGTSFYRWNTMLANSGFVFKEELIWNKSYVSSPLMQISRIHETISIHTKKSGTINKVKVPYLEMKGHDLDSIISDIKRLKTTFKNTKSFDAVMEFLEKNNVPNDGKRKHLSTTVSSLIDSRDRCASVMNAISNGMTERTIIRTDKEEMLTSKGPTTRAGLYNTDRSGNVMQSITFGLNEKSIIRITGEHYSVIHPTQKPVRLLERLLQLVSKEGDLIIDPFAGSFSTAVACMNLNRNFKGWEIDEEYFTEGEKRVNKVPRTIFSTAI